jgi:hypothetical protein
MNNFYKYTLHNQFFWTWAIISNITVTFLNQDLKPIYTLISFAFLLTAFKLKYDSLKR